jgi:hypothetical protein
MVSLEGKKPAGVGTTNMLTLVVVAIVVVVNVDKEVDVGASDVVTEVVLTTLVAVS